MFLGPVCSSGSRGRNCLTLSRQRRQPGSFHFHLSLGLSAFALPFLLLICATTFVSLTLATPTLLSTLGCLHVYLPLSSNSDEPDKGTEFQIIPHFYYYYYILPLKCLLSKTFSLVYYYLWVCMYICVCTWMYACWGQQTATESTVHSFWWNQYSIHRHKHILISFTKTHFFSFFSQILFC